MEKSDSLFQIIKVSYFGVIICFVLTIFLFTAILLFDLNGDSFEDKLQIAGFILSVLTVIALFLNYNFQKKQLKTIIAENRKSTNLQVVLSIRSNLLESFNSNQFEYESEKMNISDFSKILTDKLILPYAKFQDEKLRNRGKQNSSQSPINVDKICEDLDKISIESLRKFVLVSSIIESDLLHIYHKENHTLVTSIIPVQLKLLFKYFFEFHNDGTYQEWLDRCKEEDNILKEKIFELRKWHRTSSLIKILFHENYLKMP